MLNILAGIILIIVLVFESMGIIYATRLQEFELLLAYVLSMFLTLCFALLLGRASK